MTTQNVFGQAQAFISKSKGVGQAQAKISTTRVYAQAQAYLWPYKFAQAQALIAGIWVRQTAANGNSGGGVGSIGFSQPLAGNLLIVAVTRRGTDASVVTFSAGWKDWPYASNANGSNSSSVAIGWKISDGTETSVTLGNAAQATFMEVMGFVNPFPVTWASQEFNLDTTPTVPTITPVSGTNVFLYIDQAKNPATPNPGPSTITGYTAGPDTGFAFTGNRHRNTAWYKIVTPASGSYGGMDIIGSSDSSERGEVIHIAWAEGIFWESAQAQTQINSFGVNTFGQSQTYISPAFNQPVFGQALATILATINRFAQVKARILAFGVTQFGQAQALLPSVGESGQAQASILATSRVFGQALAFIGHFQSGNAQADILAISRKFAQAQAYIGHFKSGQAQAYLHSFDQPHFGQAQAFIHKSAGYANASVWIKATYYGIAQVQASILPNTGKGQAATWTKQTYPLMSLDINYALLSLGASASDSTGQLVTPNYTIDGNDYGTPWILGTSQDQYIVIDLGQIRTINYYRVLPVRYDCTVVLQYNGDTFFTHYDWQTIATLPQFNVGIFDDVDTSRIVTGEIPPTSAREWRLVVIDGGSYNSTGIASIELGWATVKSGTFAQAAALLGHFGVAQAQAYISPGFGIAFGQAKADIVRTFQTWGQAQAYIIPPTVVGQATADILQISNAFAQVPAWVIPPTVIAQALATIKAYDVEGLGQATADIHQIYSVVANAKAFITKTQGIGLALADIKTSRNWSTGQARARVGNIMLAQAQAYLIKAQIYGQAKADIKVKDYGFGQAMASITKPLGHAYALADIKQIYRVFGLVNSLIDDRFALAQVNAKILTTYTNYGQASVHIHNIATNYSNPYAQSQAMIHIRHYDEGQAQAWIHLRHNPTGNAMAFINNFRIAQAQARMLAFNVPKTGQAGGYILASQITTPPVGPSSEYHTYLVRFNGYDLPGYAQDESYDSNMNIVSLYSYLINAAESEYTGLANKTITITMKTWEPTYLECKRKVEKAATMLRSSRGFARLFIQRSDAYYLALVKSIEVQKAVKESMRTLDYRVTFEVLPWLIENEALPEPPLPEETIQLEKLAQSAALIDSTTKVKHGNTQVLISRPATRTKTAQSAALIASPTKVKLGQANAQIITLPSTPSNFRAVEENSEVILLWS